MNKRILALPVLFILLIPLIGALYTAPYDVRERDVNISRYYQDQPTGRTPTEYDAVPIGFEFLNWVRPSFKNINLVSDGNILIIPNILDSTILLGLKPDINFTVVNVQDINATDANSVNIGVSQGAYLNRLVATGDSNFASLEANDAYLTNLTATGTITSRAITIFDTIPILIFKDSTYVGDTSLGYIEWRDSANTRLGYFGNSSSGNDDLYWKNESSGGHIRIGTTGAGEFKVFADINAQDNDITTTGTLAAGDSNFASMGISKGLFGISDNKRLVWDEGLGSFAAGVYSPIASGTGSVALNDATTASGLYSMAIGTSTTASGTRSFAGGRSTTSTGNASFAFGYSDLGDIIASQHGAIAMGYTNGGQILSKGYGSLVFGRARYAGGSIQVSSSIYGGFAGGTVDFGTIKVADDGAFAYGFVDDGNMITEENGAIAMGYVDDALMESDGQGSIAMGYVDTIPAKLRSIGDGSIAMGDADDGIIESTGSGSVAMGTADDGNILSTGAGSIAMGYGVSGLLQAAGNGAISLGNITKAFGLGAVALGYDTNANGQAAIAIGEKCYAKTANAVCIGKDLNAYISNQVVVQDLNGLGTTSLNDQLTLYGNARVRRELIFPARNSAKGASAPTEFLRNIGASGDLKEPILQFSEVTQQDVYGVFHPPFDIDNSQDIEFHLMWLPGEDWTSGDFNWCLEYLVKLEDISYGSDVNITTGTPTIICEVVTPLNANAFIETEFSNTINVDNEQTLSVHFYRDVATDNGDDHGDVRFFEAEYVVNSLGEPI